MTTPEDRRVSVIFEAVDPEKEKAEDSIELLPAEDAKSYLLSPSWHPGLLPEETIFMHELGVDIELTNSVHATWLNNVAYHTNERVAPKKNGMLLGTNFRLIFIEKLEKPYLFPKKQEINLIPLNVIGNITFLITGKDESTSRTLQLWCKDWRLITLNFETPLKCLEVHKKLMERTVYSNAENVFAFAMSPPIETDMVHIMELEFIRMKLDPSKWRLTTLNQDYSRIATYPSIFIVPTDITDLSLQKSTAFRSCGRIPAVSWVSKDGVSISRASQPHTGLWAARSEDDETLVRGIFANNAHYSKRTMCIVDCRPKLSAVGNMAKGLGYEKPEGYSVHCCEIKWMGIDNIHAMRNSLRDLYKLCLESKNDPKWLSNLEYTKWIDHLSIVITTAVQTAELVMQGSSVLVHCSDGWDRTPQITSLTQLMLDPYYRTLIGFLALISKEWITFGHKFGLRTGHGCGDVWNNDQCSPIFHQWVDAVWQGMDQFPQCFEFNEAFLIDLLDNLYNCCFVEFLFNSEKEMTQSKRCHSLWAKYMKNPQPFLNPFYAETNEPRVILPDPSPKRLRFWAGYYLRYYQPMEEGLAYIYRKGAQLKSQNSALQDELDKARKKLDREATVREELEAEILALRQSANSNEIERDEIRRRSLECKVISEEGEGTVYCKIGVEDIGGTSQALKHIQIFEDYDPAGPASAHDHIGIVASAASERDEPLSKSGNNETNEKF